MTNFVPHDAFLENAATVLSEIYDMIENLPEISLQTLEPQKTVFVIVDMINGFAREGALKSNRVEELVPTIVNLSKACDTLGISKLAFADSHSCCSPEFHSYPQHCLEGTSESEVVGEIKAVGGYTLIKKNSTNGFLEEKFHEWLRNHTDIDTYIIAGDCTDICVQQFATTLKAYFNKLNKPVRVIVPENAVATYDAGLHHGDLMQLMALFNMMTNGIEIVKRINPD